MVQNSEPALLVTFSCLEEQKGLEYVDSLRPLTIGVNISCELFIKMSWKTAHAEFWLGFPDILA